MSTPERALRYTRIAMALHWLVGLLVLGEIAFGFLLGEIPRGTPARATYVNLHKSIGLAILVLVALRLAWRFTHRPPALPGFMSRALRRAADSTHAALYACLVALPLVGYIASNFSRHGVLLFGLVKLRPWGPDNPALYALFTQAHAVIAYVLTALVLLHLAAALQHAHRRDGIVDRMLPPRT